MVIGKILKPQGIKGELKIKSQIDEDNFFHIESVIIDGQTYTIQKVRANGGFVFVFFNEIRDRNGAELLRDKDIYVEKEKLLPLDENHYYIDDLIGCVIKTQDNKKLGKVVDVNNYGASDILTIKDGSEEILCPFLNKVFLTVDVENKIITVSEKDFLEVTKVED